VFWYESYSVIILLSFQKPGRGLNSLRLISSFVSTGAILLRIWNQTPSSITGKHYWILAVYLTMLTSFLCSVYQSPSVCSLLLCEPNYWLSPILCLCDPSNGFKHSDYLPSLPTYPELWLQLQLVLNAGKQCVPSWASKAHTKAVWKVARWKRIPRSLHEIKAKWRLKLVQPLANREKP
jgi:hypothetical protein